MSSLIVLKGVNRKTNRYKGKDWWKLLEVRREMKSKEKTELKARTLHVFSNAFWIYGKGMSGGEKLTLEVLKRWGEFSNGWNMVLYTPVKFYNIIEDECDNNFEYYLTSKKVDEGNSIIRGYILRTIKALRAIPYFSRNHVFYSTSDFLPDVIPAVIGKLFNRKSKWKIIVHHIYESYKTRPGSKITNFISCTQQKISLFLAKHYADTIIIESPLVHDYMKQKNYNEHKIVYAECGVNYEEIQEALKDTRDIPEFEGVFLGRLNGSKGIFELPEIWSHVTCKFPNARLAIIGNGSEENKSKLETLIKDYNMQDNIKMLGYLENEDAYRYMGKAKIFVFPSHEEGWGISISEGMAAGLPVVAYHLPIYDFVFKKGMVKVPLKEYSKFSDEVIRLLEDESYRVQKGSEAKAFVKRYDWKEVARKEYEILLK